jgi:inner membrane protein
MPSAITHALVGAALAAAAPRELPRVRLALTLALLSALPDLDVIGLRLGIPYEHALGHRGITHSLAFAALAGAAVGSALFRGRGRAAAVALSILAIASHGFLDAFTDAGLGIGFFLPFDPERFFFAFRPLRTSPLSVSAFFSGRGLEILRNELLWIWLPLLVALGLCALLRRGRRV